MSEQYNNIRLDKIYLDIEDLINNIYYIYDN